jgi:hypothetical protein
VLDIPPGHSHNEPHTLVFPAFKGDRMADPQDHVFSKLRGIIGGYLVDLILEEGAEGVARLIHEGLEARSGLEPDADEQVMRLLRRLEEGL